MADQSDVEQALAAIAAGLLYPDGASGASALGAVCRIFRGWPDQASLDAALAAGDVTVTINADPRIQRTTTRFPSDWLALRASVPALQVTTEGNKATFAGSPDPGQIAGIMADQTVAVHRTVAGDSLPAVAAALAKALGRTTARLGGAVAHGSSVIVPGVNSFIARVVADQPAIRETRRQLQAFRVTVWSSDPALRDAAGATIDSGLAAIDFIGLADGTAGRLRYAGSTVTDRARDAYLYRRDLAYAVDYATTCSADLPRMLFGDSRTVTNGSSAHSLLS